MRRWAALALLLGATAATLATIAVVVFQLADDGGALVAEAGRPSARRCRLTKLKLQTRLGARHSRLRSPLRREGPGLVLLGAAGGRRASRTRMRFARRSRSASTVASAASRSATRWSGVTSALRAASRTNHGDTARSARSAASDQKSVVAASCG